MGSLSGGEELIVIGDSMIDRVDLVMAMRGNSGRVRTCLSGAMIGGIRK